MAHLPNDGGSKVLCATWQDRRGSFVRNVIAHAGKSGRRLEADNGRLDAFVGIGNHQLDAAPDRAAFACAGTRSRSARLRPEL